MLFYTEVYFYKVWLFSCVVVHSSLETFQFFLFIFLSIHFTIMFLGLGFLFFMQPFQSEVFYPLSVREILGHHCLKYLLFCEMATRSGTLAWKIPWTEKPGRLWSMGLQSRIRLSDFTFTFCVYIHFFLSK